MSYCRTILLAKYILPSPQASWITWICILYTQLTCTVLLL